MLRNGVPSRHSGSIQQFPIVIERVGLHFGHG